MSPSYTSRKLKAVCIGAVFAGALIVMTGCSNKQAAAPNVIPLPPPTATTGITATEPSSVSSSTTMSPHGANMDMGSSDTLTPTPDLDAKIAKLEKNGGSTKALSTLYALRGDERMMDQKASPHIKYSAALSDYSKAVKLDPANKAAANNKALIESIYRGMGRPIPPE